METIYNLLKTASSLNVFTHPSLSKPPFIARLVKYLVMLVFLLNIRSAPFSWHLRIFRPYFYLKLNWWSLFAASRKTKEKWLESLSPVGMNVIDYTLTYKTWASLDDCDYNMHLSNSCYAKAFDMVRMKSAFALFTAFMRDGGWIALSATNYHFIREIPMFRSYSVSTRIVAWDNKWLYSVAYFVTKKKGGKGTAQKEAKKLVDALNSESSFTLAEPAVPMPSLHTPAFDISTPAGTATPASLPEFSPKPIYSPDDIIHCVAIAQCCFKIGRITVPPTVAFATQGLCLSREHWEKVQDIRKRGGMHKFLSGGWRDVPESDRWWEDAYAPFEQMRIRNIAACDQLKTVMELAKSF